MNWEERIGRNLKLRDLHTLQVVSEFGSMAKASQQLGLSQPAISKAIAEMEQALGVPLLDRSSTGVQVTSYGRLMVDRARVIFDEVRQSVEDIRLFRESDVLRHIFERVVWSAMAACMVKGEGFAVDASVLEANTSRYHGKPPAELDWTDA